MSDENAIVKVAVDLRPPQEDRTRNLPVDDDRAVPELEVCDQRWFTPAADDKGHGSSITCKVMPQVGRIIDEIISLRRFPYKDKKDLFRHAIYRHLAWLKLNPNVPANDLFVKYTVLDKILRAEEENRQHIDVITRTETLVRQALERNDRGGAIQFMDELREQVFGIDDPKWKARYLQEINRISKALLGTPVKK